MITAIDSVTVASFAESRFTDSRPSVHSLSALQVEAPIRQPNSFISNPKAQFTSVSQLSDVRPDAWAFQELQSLLERYGCMAGYPDGAFLGDWTMTRSEFAAGLNRCLDQMIATIDDRDMIEPIDLLTIQRLQEEFAVEFAILHAQAQSLDNRTAELDANQFSTTTKLQGELIMGLSQAVGADINDAPVFQESIELTLNTSFTGEDVLEVSFESGNFTEFSFIGNLTFEGQLGFSEDTEDDRIEFGGVSYEFPIGDRLSVIVGDDDNISDFNPLLGSSSDGAISEFGQENPIHSLVEDTGIGLNYIVSDALIIGAGYFSGEADDPLPGNGLFDGNYSAHVQLAFEPSETLLLGFTYIHSYNDSDLETDTGSVRSQVALDRPVIGNSFGLNVSLLINPNLAIGGWGGLTNATVIGLGEARIWNYALTLAFPDLGGEGNLLGLIVGQEPKLTNTSGFEIEGAGRDPDTSFHIEALYRYQVTDNLSITPGLIWVTAPNHDNNNSDIVVVTVRNTFEF